MLTVLLLRIVKPTTNTNVIYKDGDVHPADKGVTAASTIVVGDYNVSDSDEQNEVWVCLDRVTLNFARWSLFNQQTRNICTSTF